MKKGHPRQVRLKINSPERLKYAPSNVCTKKFTAATAHRLYLFEFNFSKVSNLVYFLFRYRNRLANIGFGTVAEVKIIYGKKD